MLELLPQRRENDAAITYIRKIISAGTSAEELDHPTVRMRLSLREGLRIPKQQTLSELVRQTSAVPGDNPIEGIIQAEANRINTSMTTLLCATPIMVEAKGNDTELERLFLECHGASRLAYGAHGTRCSAVHNLQYMMTQPWQNKGINKTEQVSPKILKNGTTEITGITGTMDVALQTRVHLSKIGKDPARHKAGEPRQTKVNRGLDRGDQDWAW